MSKKDNRDASTEVQVARTYDLAVDDNGNVYVAYTDNKRIIKIRDDGIATTFVSGVNSTNMIADGAGNVYIVDKGNHRIRQLTPRGKVITIADGTRKFRDGKGKKARFYCPIGVAVDSKGNVYVAYTEKHQIWKITLKGEVSIFAGDGNRGYADGVGTEARFNGPKGLGVDSKGNVYVTDKNNLRIRKVTPDGVVSTLAGGTKGCTDDMGDKARFQHPQGVVVDSSDNVYVADTHNNRIRKITSEGEVSTIAGNGRKGFRDGKEAWFNWPKGLGVDSKGNVYVADSNNHRIRKILSGGEVITFAGDGKEGHADGKGAEAQFSYPIGVAVDGEGNIYVADTLNDMIRKVTPDGVVSTFARGSYSGFATGFDSTKARFHRPLGVAVDRADNIYVVDGDTDRIWKLTPEGEGNILAGNEDQFDRPHGLAVDAVDNIYVSDTCNNRIWKITPDGKANILAGGTQGLHDGIGATAQFDCPHGLALDGSGYIYVADTGNHRIRKITPDGVVRALAGSGVQGFKDGVGAEFKYSRGVHLAMACTAPEFYNPQGVAVDEAGNVYVADTWNNRIRKVTPGGVVSTIAGDGTEGFQDGNGAEARFHRPLGVAVDKAGNVYVADSENNRIRKITPAGEVNSFAGNGKLGYQDGDGKEARFNYPTDLAVDLLGNVYVADSENHLIRKIVLGRVVTTFAGKYETSGYVDGVGTKAEFYCPFSLALDKAGNLYVADHYNYRIRKITPDGVVTTLKCTFMF